MENTKKTKRALLSSILSVILCMAMLIGTTFAWFTDSVTSGKNKIAAGNLDVELEYRDQNGEWKTVTADTNLFSEDALWEPGHTEVVYLRVKNAAALALKYQLTVTAANETTFTNALGETDCRLSDYLVFGQAESDTEITQYATREDAWAAAGNTQGLSDYAKESVLYPAEAADGPSEQYIALVVYMPTAVGNEANYRGDAIPSIDLGVNLVATQTSYETDSFGNDYDAFDFDEEGIIVNKNEDGKIVSAIVPEGTTVLKANTFKNQTALTSVSLPSTLTEIEKSAFYGCSSLKEIEIPDGVTSIGSAAFQQAYSLTKVKLPTNLTAIGSQMFAYCRALTEIEVPDGVTTIGKDAFYHCDSLAEINIPDSVTSMGAEAFRSCSSLTNMVLPDSVTTIGVNAFYGCESLETFKLSANLESIGGACFRDCSKLKAIDLPAGLQSIGSLAFMNTGLTSIEIPASVTSLEGDAFSDCPELMTITVADGNPVYRSEGNCLIKGNTIIAGCSGSDLTQTSGITAIGPHAFDGTAITEVHIPDTVTTIGDRAFQDCAQLTAVDIPEKVTKIPHGGFEGCRKLERVTMGNSVTEIGGFAFNCCNIKSITLPSTLTSIQQYGFGSCPLTRVEGCTNLTYIGRETFSYQLEYLDLKFGYWNGSGAYKGKKITNGEEAAKLGKKYMEMRFTTEADW